MILFNELATPISELALTRVLYIRTSSINKKIASSLVSSSKPYGWPFDLALRSRLRQVFLAIEFGLDKWWLFGKLATVKAEFVIDVRTLQRRSNCVATLQCSDNFSFLRLCYWAADCILRGSLFSFTKDWRT